MFKETKVNVETNTSSINVQIYWILMVSVHITAFYYSVGAK